MADNVKGTSDDAAVPGVAGDNPTGSEVIGTSISGMVSVRDSN